MGPARAGSVKSYPRIEPPTERSPQGHELALLIYFGGGGALEGRSIDSTRRLLCVPTRYTKLQMKTISTISLCILVYGLSAPASHARAQDGPVAEGNAPVGLLDSPAMPRLYWGQTSRFTNAFNPAIGLAVDGTFSHVESDDLEGYKFDLNLAELTMQGPLSPNWWGNFALEANTEEVELSESALYYTGIGERSSLRAGKFFIDFGKQMQIHVHDLSTPQRPAVLREYLGAELPGTGVQFDHWSPIGEETAFRFSAGLFSDMNSHGHGSLFEKGGDHGHGGEDHDEVGMHLEDRRELSDLIMTARATAMKDVGTNGIFQLGTSLRSLPEFGFEGGEDDAGDELEVDGLDQSVIGFDLSYGWDSDDGTKGWDLGLEFLRMEGALAAEVVDDGLPTASLDVYDGSAQGWFAFVEHDWNQQNGFGVMVSAFEHLEEGAPMDTETSIYWSHYPTEYTRFRVAAINREVDEGEDSQALLFQLTGYFGAHGHPYNW